MKQGYERIGRSVHIAQAKRACLNKKRFSSRNEARDKAARQSNSSPEWYPARPYKCTLCGGFHLTTIPGGKRRKP